MNQYKAVTGSILSDDEAQVYGEHIVSLIEENNGLISAEIVVDDASREVSPLHDYFEWDDQVAAMEYRLNRARVLMRSIQVVIKADDQERTAVLCEHIKIKNGDITESGYTTIMRVMTDEDLRRQTVERALHELQSWQRRYRDYHELGRLFEVVENARQMLLPVEAQGTAV